MNQRYPVAARRIAGRVLRASPEGDEAGEDEREPGGRREAGDEPGVRVVVAREDEGDGDGRLDERHDARKREAQCPHLSRFTTASPESSAFAMKPRAPLDSISDP